jgi:tetratricopeptide (TPR) repeat protein
MIEESLFAAALEWATAAERRAFLDEACAGDVALRQRVERLLAAHEKTLGIVDQMAGPARSPEVTAGTRPVGASTGERVGDLVAGRYRLLEAIGEGGMGAVWKAEQTQPVRRTVAVKLIRVGMDSRTVLARFEAERQALALMDHPNIAKVHDGGTTEGVRPFFVMEYVEGVPITQHCDDARLSIAERLALVVPVCQAVQHAHSKGIIHRDLKPSNILVGSYDGRPVPKVIDFGLAKAMHQPLTEHTLHTAHGAMVGTPLYMSPEQAEFHNLDVDTRADVYALGVVLYELLTGTTPLERQRFKEAAWDEILRLIKEEEPPRPSARLSGSDSLPSLAAQRQLEPSRLTRLVRGELDWIVMKCLEKDRSRRYETANDLARDIECYLRDEPVEASPPGAGYRLRKFARRHRTALATAAAFVLLLLVGGVVSAWQAVRATRAEAASRRAEKGAKAQRDSAVAEKKRADEERAIAQAVNEFLQKDLLGQADIANQAAGVERNRDITVRALLDRAAQGIEARFKGQVLTEAAIRLTLGKAYRGLGEYAEARKHLGRSLDLRRQKLGAGHRDTLESEYSLALLYYDLDRYDDSEGLHKQVLEVRSTRLGADDPDTLRSMNDLGLLYCERARYGDAEPLLRQALDLRRAKLGADHLDTLESMANLAYLFWARGEYPAAEPWCRQARDGLRAKLGADHPYTLKVMHNLANIYMMLDRLDEAEPLFEQGLAVARARLGPDHPVTLDTMHQLAGLHDKRGRAEQAESMHKKIVEVRRAKQGPGHLDTLRSMQNLGVHYWRHGRYDEAEPLIVQVLAALRVQLGDDHPETLVTMHNLGALYRDRGRLVEAEVLLREAVTGAKKRHGLDHPNMPNFVNNFADVHAKLGTPHRAEPLLRELVSFLRDRPGTDPTKFAIQLGWLSDNLRAQKKYVEAEPILRECLDVATEHYPDSWRFFNIQSKLGDVLVKQERYAEAEPLLIQGYQGIKTREDQVPAQLRSRLVEAAERLVRLYEAWGRPEKAAEWRTKLPKPDRAKPEP